MEHMTQCDYSDVSRLIQSWGFWRDNCEWDALLSAYTDDGRMATSWAELTAVDFVAACRNGMNQTRYTVQHAFGASLITSNGDRALAQTRLTLLLRGQLHEQEVDVTSYGRAYDRLVRTPSGWKIQLRNNIYEKSRIDPVMPGAVLPIDEDRLRMFPEAYRHLAYFQSANGAKVPLDLPRPGSPELEKLIEVGEAWLAGDKVAGEGHVRI